MKNFLTGNDHLLYTLIRKTCDKSLEARCWVSRQTMCEWLGLSKTYTKVITASVRRIESVGLIVVVRQHRPNDPYVITLTLDSEERYDKLLQVYLEEAFSEIEGVDNRCKKATQLSPLYKENNLIIKIDSRVAKKHLFKHGEMEWEDVLRTPTEEKKEGE